MLRQLEHNGVVVPALPGPHNLTLNIRGRPVALTPEQEEMAIAWARKLGTPYVEDEIFVRNFLGDFARALGIEPPLEVGEVDFTQAAELVAAKRADREALTREERKTLAAERRAAREALRERYGYAVVDGERTELGTYLVEPSSIFMGRGEHPLRGRWKEGPKQRDITLNHSPDGPLPEGDWAGIIWRPESMWVARWKDKLSGKTKYVWLADTAPIKQRKEARKFDQAIKLGDNLQAVRAHIEEALDDEDPRRRMVATACYLIDHLCLRVGDEKDPDEADTVGATTLRPEHITLHDDGAVEFRFLGKDAVLWHKKVELPEVVQRNLAELADNARPSRNGWANGNDEKLQLFPGVGSRDVNAFLGEVQKGLTAKVFRTCHATVAVEKSLADSRVSKDAPDFQKREAAQRANLAAAVLCNHYKKASPRWPERQEKARARREQLEERVQKAREQVQERQEQLAEVRVQVREKEEAAKTDRSRERAKASGRKKVERAKKRLETARRKLERAELALARHNSKASMAFKTRTWNLGTSLKSYVDPRVYYQWGGQVGYDVLEAYYPKTLRKKFAWAREDEEEPEESRERVAEGAGT